MQLKLCKLLGADFDGKASEGTLNQLSWTGALQAYLHLSKNYFESWHRGQDLT